MYTIYKYPFPICNPNSVATMYLPKGAAIIRLDIVDGYPFLWAIVNTESPLVKRKFYLHKTGSDMTNTVKEINVNSEKSLKQNYVGRFGIWAEMELMMYVFDGGEVDEGVED